MSWPEVANDCKIAGGVMWSFFHGWRRKMGVLTLVLTSALWCLWVRSSQYVDSVGLANGDRSYHAIWSYHGSIVWTLIPCTKGTIPAVIRKCYGWHTMPVASFAMKKR